MSTRHLHTALFRWKDGAPLADLEVCLQRIAECQPLVPGVRKITWGLNRSSWAQGYTHVLHVDADSAQALAAYRANDMRRTANELIVKWEAGVVSADFDA